MLGLAEGAQLLQHLPTVPALVVLAVAARRRWLTDPAMACVVAFVFLHVIGARWVYSAVPYEDWLAAIGTALETERNHYDRFVHFAFGGLAVLPFAELVLLRCFAGLSMRELSEVMGLAERTAERRWRSARAWLYARMTASGTTQEATGG